MPFSRFLTENMDPISPILGFSWMKTQRFGPSARNSAIDQGKNFSHEKHSLWWHSGGTSVSPYTVNFVAYTVKNLRSRVYTVNFGKFCDLHGEFWYLHGEFGPIQPFTRWDFSGHRFTETGVYVSLGSVRTSCLGVFRLIFDRHRVSP